MITSRGGQSASIAENRVPGQFRCIGELPALELYSVELSHLGAPTGPMIRVHGGFANRTYRLGTDQGSFAVKELNLVDRRSTYHVEDVFRFDRAAFAAGIPMPEPISASHRTLVHRWVEGEKVPEAPVSEEYAFEIGEILARIHALDVDWTQMSIEDPTPRDWPELAERAVAPGQPWANELASNVETFLAIAHFVDTCERPGRSCCTRRPEPSLPAGRPAATTRLLPDALICGDASSVAQIRGGSRSMANGSPSLATDSSDPADAPTARSGVETRGHRIHPIERPAVVVSKLAEKTMSERSELTLDPHRRFVAR
ncbi:phosphotransferase [Dactylosporangium sp. CA-233914]|uniref:phosphotransferase n=1 Tax=Dactylosporangium sp. CA-233914 TaxID=3239934 RepID=UPI003D916F5F